MTTSAAHPESIESVEDLEDRLSRPTVEAERSLQGADGDVLILGAGGKMGPTLARMIKRAAPQRRVVAVSRFSEPGLADRLRSWDIEVRVGDLLDDAFLSGLPDAANVFYLAGMKFGATGKEPLTWAMNAWLPGRVAERFSESRIVALSTGNVYGMTSVSGPGSGELDVLDPVGEYANSCLGRERIFQYFSEVNGTPMVLVRLNYANELRYGVVVDLAQRILGGEAIDLSMGWVNLIWQGDANAQIVASLEHVSSPAFFLNVAGSPHRRVRELCLQIGELAGVEPMFVGQEGNEALLSDTSRSQQWFGEHAERVPPEVFIPWVVNWLRSGGPTLGKPTKFENREGKF